MVEQSTPYYRYHSTSSTRFFNDETSLMMVLLPMVTSTSKCDYTVTS
jgi:hypothetical protein